MFRLTIAAATLAFFVVAADISGNGAAHAPKPTPRATTSACSRDAHAPASSRSGRTNRVSQGCELAGS
ncbi:MAG TPA: hypothetical protein VID24_01985 [Candidatus Eremiobacteraceae bacterium]|jgi:hypothetical protein